MTPAATPEALEQALARELARLDGWQDPEALWTDNLGIIARGGEGSPVYLDYVEDAGKLIAGPLAPILANLQRVTAEKDARGEVIATLSAEAASLRAEVEARDRALKAAKDKLEAVCNAISVAAEWERAAERSRQREDERLRRNPLIRGAVEAARAATAGEGRSDG